MDNNIFSKFIENAAIYKARRLELTPELLVASLKAQKELEAKINSQTQTSIKSDTLPLTEEQITNFGSTINEEFDLLSPHYKNMRDKNDEQGYQDMYFLCINKIKEIGCHVFCILKDLTHCNKKGTIDNAYIFQFICQKNNYKFTLSYHNDYKYGSRLLIDKIIYVLNNMEISTWANFFDENDVNIGYILRLLTSISLSNYTKSNFKHFVRLPKMLKKKYSIEIVSIDKTKPYFSKFILNPDQCELSLIGFFVNVNGIEMLIYVEGYNNDIRIMGKPDRWDIYTRKSFSKSRPDRFDKYSILMEYESDTDIEILYKNIIAYQEYKAGLYGYYCDANNHYYNDNYISYFLNNIPEIKYGKSITRCSSYKDHSKTRFSVEVSFDLRTRENMKYVPNNQYSYYFENYKINFNYDDTSVKSSTLSINTETDTILINATFIECYQMLEKFVDDVIKMK